MTTSEGRRVDASDPLAARARPTTERLGRALRQARRAQGLDQQDLADALDVHRSYLVAVESGRTTLALSRLIVALELVGLELDVRERRPTPIADA
jgi:transcriptional regulator with XRE-family HTH domain